ncbi:SET domain-containing protein [Cucurbitaria berberidis CBS 394.84]|uniref:SET domain-containing protein n=1 Tax=Cucurbitaria berberidis CBS 394.84 TaxID=1168544 RepID=A0A9P4GJ88_9PLEO|nr:SET domain-containing protein [Cucurbitaria berberidis CBS 394.84]KAF1847233.1 SET domain-containing protein [Cucurbitaria berberidis CBS 394.84]
MAQPTYRIVNIGVIGGFGMVANDDIPSGALILQENPLLVVDTQILNRNWNGGATFFNDERDSRTQRVRSALRSQPRNHRHAFRDLANGITPPGTNQTIRDVNIVETNAWNFENPTVNNNTWLAVGNDFSRVNHSCMPNARITDVCTVAPNLGQMRLLATRDIDADAEILVEYAQDGVWLQPRNVRRAILQQHWHFHCLCNACHSNYSTFFDAKWEYANVLRAEIYFQLPAPQQTFIVSHRIEAAEQYIDILKKGGFGDRRLVQAYIRLAELYMLAAKYTDAHAAGGPGVDIGSE